LRVGRFFGVPLFLSPSWLFIALLITLTYSELVQQTVDNISPAGSYAVAFAFAVLLAISLLAHELGHTAVSLAFGMPVKRVVIFLLGGVSEIEKEPDGPAQEYLVAVAGPLVSLVLAAAGGCLLPLTDSGTIARTMIFLLVWSNLAVAVFNLLPGLPLDGGRMLRAVIWKFTGRPTSATIAAAWVGRVLALALLAIPFFSGSLAGGDIVSTLWVVVIAAFMWTGASGSIKASRFRERLPALQARRLARRAVAVESSTPLAEAVRRADEAGARAIVVIDHESKPIAIVNEAAVSATPPQRRPWLDVGSLARTLDPGMILSADLQGMGLLDALRRTPSSEYLLVEPTGEVVGVLAASDLDQVFAGV
jgi:Zn-dependent protease/CBS domain-containing protein